MNSLANICIPVQFYCQWKEKHSKPKLRKQQTSYSGSLTQISLLFSPLTLESVDKPSWKNFVLEICHYNAYLKNLWKTKYHLQQPLFLHEGFLSFVWTYVFIIWLWHDLYYLAYWKIPSFWYLVFPGKLLVCTGKNTIFNFLFINNFIQYRIICI